MQMDNRRCKTPQQVRTEIWTHMVAYNLIRTIMAQAAATHGLEPRSISFKGACQMLAASQQLIELQAADDCEHRLELYHHLLDAIARQRVVDRPDRFGPRMKKQRPDHYRGLMQPRAEIKRLMAKGFRNI
jgi:hypothetical protein